MSFNNKVISKVQSTKCKQQNGAWESTKKLTQENCLIVSSHFLACKVTDVLYNLLFTCPPTGQHNQQHQQGITKVFCLGNSKVLHQFLYSVGNAVTQANHLRFNVSNLVTSFFQKHRRCKWVSRSNSDSGGKFNTCRVFNKTSTVPSIAR